MRSDFGEVYSNGVPLMPIAGKVAPNNVFWVSSLTGSNDNPGNTKYAPFATIDYAIGKCTANKGDIIYVLPGHTEAVAAAGGIACDVAGITIEGLGRGSLRPIVTLGSLTSASVTIAAANISVKNILFTSALDNVATCFTVSAKDALIDGCEFRDASASLHMLSYILTSAVANACDGLTVKNCKVYQLATAGTAFISILEDNDRVTITDNVMTSLSTADAGHFIISSSKNLTNAEIARNKMYVTGAANASVGIFMTGSGTGHTGTVDNNYVWSLDTGGALFCTATLTFGLFENYVSGAVGASGAIWPAADNPA
jgi:hypothetical protein